MLTAYLQFNNDELKCVIFSFELMLVFCVVVAAIVLRLHIDENEIPPHALCEPMCVWQDTLNCLCSSTYKIATV